MFLLHLYVINGEDVNTILSSGCEDNLGQSSNKEPLTEMVGSKVVMKGMAELLIRSDDVKYLALSLKNGIVEDDVSRDGYCLFLN